MRYGGLFCSAYGGHFVFLHPLFAPTKPDPFSPKLCLQGATGKNIDAAGAGATMASPAWLTQLNLLWSGKGVRVQRQAATF
jgi:hypothetical protein